MDTAELLSRRLRSLLIDDSSAKAPHDVISHLLAMQAQDYPGALWAVGLRLPDSAIVADVERAIAERTIVRTWPMRGTLHFVTAEDVRWLQPLLAERRLAAAAGRERQLKLDALTFALAHRVFSAALEGGRRLTRPAAMAALEAGGIVTAGQRGYHILWRLSLEGRLVLGPMEGRQQTFTLLDEWIPAEKSAYPSDTPREELLAVLAQRFFEGHGPATLDDLARWAGIPKAEAAAALGAVADGLERTEHAGKPYWFARESGEGGRPAADGRGRVTADGAAAASAPRRRVHLLPGFDEYILGYSLRSHQLGDHLDTFGAHVASNGMFAPTVVVDGRVVGIWKRTFRGRGVAFSVTEFERLGKRERAGIAQEQQRYARFFGRELASP